MRFASLSYLTSLSRHSDLFGVKTSFWHHNVTSHREFMCVCVCVVLNIFQRNPLKLIGMPIPRTISQDYIHENKIPSWFTTNSNISRFYEVVMTWMKDFLVGSLYKSSFISNRLEFFLPNNFKNIFLKFPPPPLTLYMITQAETQFLLHKHFKNIVLISPPLTLYMITQAEA